jgi:hypothetical protein
MPLIAFVASGYGVSSHTDCTREGSLGSVIRWTPFGLVNSPYLGATHWHTGYWVLEAGLNISVAAQGNITNGTVVGDFETANWTVYSQGNQTVPGPGLDHPCLSAAIAIRSMEEASSVSGGTGLLLQGPGNTSDVNEPTTFNASSTPGSLEFSGGFVAANLPPISTCGTSAKELNWTSGPFAAGLTMQTRSGPVSLVVTIPAEGRYVYTFPAEAGTWLVDNTALNPGLPGPGLAFYWTHC